MDAPIVLPQPQRLTWTQGPEPGDAPAIPQHIVLEDTQDGVALAAAERLADHIGERTGRRATLRADVPEDEPAYFHLRAGESSLPAEGYRIDDDGRAIRLVAADGLGLSHAVETARQLFVHGTWPRCMVEDWPAYRHRAIYVESFWGTDLMEAADWRAFIDYMVSLKFNTLNVGLYGCWEIKFDGAPTEFMLVPLRRHPDMRTPQRVRYIDPDSGEWVEMTYLPRSAEDDLLPGVFAYARARGLRIIPQFGGPGHNTLIPRLYPDVSAKRADGQPTGYGYCVSNPATWTLLDDVIDELVARYCHPFDVAHFNIAGDEVYPIRNVLADDPQAEVSPWCACLDCRALSEFEQLSTYFLGLVRRLAAAGITSVICADTLARLGKMDDFKRLLAEQNLTEHVVIQWWCYKEPLPALTSGPELETWVEPSPGLVGNLLYQDFSRNIYGFLQRGRRACATGMTAYNVPDLRLDKNYACLAEFSWNTDAGSIAHFAIRYAQWTYGEQWRTALEAYDVAERVMGSYPLAVYVMDQLLHYFNNFPPGRIRYPVDLLRVLAGDPLAVLEALRVVAGHMDSALELLACIETNDEMRGRFELECRRYRDLALCVTAVVDGLRLSAAAQTSVDQGDIDAARAALAQARQVVDTAHEALRATMMEMVQHLVPYLQPGALREVSPLLAFLADLRTQLTEAGAAFADEAVVAMPPIPLLAEFDLEHLRAVWHPWEF